MEGQDKAKEAAGRAAVDALVKSGMKLGLGTGSTTIHAVRRVGELLAFGKLTDIAVFATSMQTEMECERLGIPVFGLNSQRLAGSLDLTIDGADEIDPSGNLIKGGGAALLIEKIAAYASEVYAVVVDEGKPVARLGTGFPVPVEVVPEARLAVSLAIEAMGGKAVLREAVRKVGPVITEHGNLILDVRFEEPVEPVIMEIELNRIPGVVENGLFSLMDKPFVFVGHADGTVAQSR